MYRAHKPRKSRAVWVRNSAAFASLAWKARDCTATVPGELICGAWSATTPAINSAAWNRFRCEATPAANTCWYNFGHCLLNSSTFIRFSLYLPLQIDRIQLEYTWTDARKARTDAIQADANTKAGKKIDLQSNAPKVTGTTGSRSRLLRALARRAPEVLDRYQAGRLIEKIEVFARSTGHDPGMNSEPI
jgi:hypothetical protein